jgi:hypothetical protein
VDEVLPPHRRKIVQNLDKVAQRVHASRFVAMDPGEDRKLDANIFLRMTPKNEARHPVALAILSPKANGFRSPARAGFSDVTEQRLQQARIERRGFGGKDWLGGAVSGTAQSSNSNAVIRPPPFALQRQIGAEIAFASTAADGSDEFAFVLGTSRHLQRSPDIRPVEIPARMPSSRARRCAVAMASSLLTVITSSTIARLRFSGTKPAPVPWIL